MKGRWRIVELAAAALLTTAGSLSGQGQRPETRVIMLTQYGFEPKQVTVRPGPVRFVFRSRIGGGDSWQITETGRTAVKAVVAERSKRVSRDLQTLTPGDYEITVSRFPQWKCAVRVQP